MYYQTAYFSWRISIYKKNKNQSRSLDLSEVLNKNNMAMADVNVFEMS